MQLVQEGRVRHLGKSQYRIQSGKNVYYVDLAAEQTCYCLDREHRPLDDCKHSLSARWFRLLQHDPAFMKTITEWIAATAVAK